MEDCSREGVNIPPAGEPGLYQLAPAPAKAATPESVTTVPPRDALPCEAPGRAPRSPSVGYLANSTPQCLLSPLANTMEVWSCTYIFKIIGLGFSNFTFGVLFLSLVNYKLCDVGETSLSIMLFIYEW